MKLGIGLPLTDHRVFSEFLFNFIVMEKPAGSMLLKPNFPGAIDKIRNNIVEQALMEGCTHLAMLDTDQIYPADVLVRLAAHNLDAVGCLIHRRYPPFAPVIYMGDYPDYDYPSDKKMFSGELLEVTATGCGCMMYNTDVFYDIDYPWFEEDWDPAKRAPIGEDINFCRKLRSVGKKIHVDTSIVIDHISMMAVNRSTYELYKLLNRVRNKGEEK